MKKLAILIIIFSLPLFAYQNIYKIPGKTKDQLFDRALLWFADEFKNSKSGIQYQNKETGTIIVQCEDLISFVVSYPVFYTLKIEVKDNKVRTTYDKIKVMNVPRTSDITWQFPEKKFEEIFVEVDNNLVDYLKKDVKSDW